MSVSAADLEARNGEALKRVQRAVCAAFGANDGLGVLVVSGLPEWYGGSRSRLLASARVFAALPADTQATYECSWVDYAVGWSCGREQFRGVVDTSKGSYYANPVHDDPSCGDSEREARSPHLLTPNIWPAAELCDMEVPFKQIGGYINTLGSHLAWHCDRYVESVVGHSFNKLHESLEESHSQKGRLLHYFARPCQDVSSTGEASRKDVEGPDKEETFWCGFHNDHGTLTGLVAAEYYSERQQSVLAVAPDKRAGLYVSCRRSNEPVRVQFSSDCLAFQTGEASQILTGGVLRATPHAVRTPGTDSSCINRSTMAVFLQPEPDLVLQLPSWDSQGRAALQLGHRVPPLSSRYCSGDTFAMFGEKTIASYVVSPSLDAKM
jgi:isopenicillin N synthase-like dioxygenase